MLNREKLNAFLWFCFIPESSTRFLQPIIEDEAHCYNLRKWLLAKCEQQAIVEGARVLQQVFDRNLSPSHGLQVVPLSGGLDSRLILAYLVEAGLREQIVAVTFGTPGTLDYEIPKIIAKHTGVRHELIDLTALSLDKEKLEYAYRFGATWIDLITAYYNYMLQEYFGEQATYWSGFLGGELAGSHYAPGHEHLSWQEAKNVFVEFNRWCKRGHTPLPESDFLPQDMLPENPIIANNNVVSYPEQLDFAIRQTSWIHKAVVGRFVNTQIPFADPEWIRFILSAPLNLRNECKLYRHIALYQFPKLFRIKTKSVPSRYLVVPGSVRYKRYALRRYGQIARLLGFSTSSKAGINEGLNYIDFAQAYRSREDFRKLAQESISCLEESEFINWLNPMSLLERHLQNGEDLSQEIQLLISLDMNLQLQQQNSLHTDHGTN